MIEFKKDGGVKIVDPNSTIIPRLIADGWSAEGYEDADDRALLLEEAKELGLKPHPNTGVEKLKAMIAEHKAEGEEE